LVAVLALGVALGAPGRASAQVIRPEEAGAHVGEVVTVEGEVPTVVCSPLACLLSFTTDYSGLVASIPGALLAGFPPPKETYTARRVRIRGTVTDRNGKPRIEIADPRDIALLDGTSGRTAAVVPPEEAPVRITVSPPPRAGPASGAEPDQESPGLVRPAPEDDGGTTRSRVIDPGRVTKRFGGPREPSAQPSGDSVVSTLTGGAGDAAAIEARALQQQITELRRENADLSATVAALEERLVVLEQSGGRPVHGVEEGALPHLPEYVVSGAGATRLQHVKRGWSSERVLRALGAPRNTVTEANGYMTWYYADGRAVTLDPRGRVASSIGF
jgi:hypothetical protein